MRAAVIAMMLVMSGCGAPEPQAPVRPAVNPLESRDVTVVQWQAGTPEQREAAALAYAYLPNARDDQRPRIAAYALRCLDRLILTAQPDDKIFEPIDGLYFECLDRYAG